MIPVLFEEFHGSPIGGHAGEDRSYQRIAAEVFWVGMRKDIANLVKQCEVCQRNKNLSGSPSRAVATFTVTIYCLGGAFDGFH